MKLGRQHAIGAIVVAALAFGGVWVMQHTEWVDTQVPVDTKGPERRDPDFRLKRVLALLGANVNAPDTLARLPPQGATLVLTSWHWNLFPERSQALRRWVEAGGDLVVPHAEVKNGGLDWLSVKSVPLRRRSAAAQRASPPNGDSDSDSDSDDDANEAPPPAAPFGKAPGCASVHEPASIRPAFGVARTYATCIYPHATLQTKLPITWSLDVPQGHVVIRVPVGRGSVTLTGTSMPWNNERVLEQDNALIAAAVLRAASGRDIWFVSNEARAPLLTLLWQRGAPAVLLGMLALGFALWRGAVRFGPRAPSVPAARRSVAEQIRGTAGFIAHHGGGAALHAAQLRALDEAARQRLNGFDALILGERALAIAHACAMDATSLARAMNPQLTPALARHPGPALALMETARRRLLNAPRAGAAKPTSNP